MLLYLRTVLIFAHSVMILMIRLLFMLFWRATPAKCFLPHCKCTEELHHLFFFWETLLMSSLPSLIPPLCSFTRSSSSSISHMFPHGSSVWRLHPGQRRHHPVAWLSRLLPTQPELHVDNRDLPWQRLAEKFRVNTCSSQIQFPLQCHFPLRCGLFILPNKLSLDDWSAERLA